MNIEGSNNRQTTSGRWTELEHKKFLLGIQLFGKNWKKIEGLVQTRSGAQIRSHAQKFFQKRDPNSNDFMEEWDSSSQSSKRKMGSEDQDGDSSHYFQQMKKLPLLNENFSFWEQLVDAPITSNHQTMNAKQQARPFLATENKNTGLSKSIQRIENQQQPVNFDE